MKNIFLILFLFVVQAGISQSMVVWVDYHEPVKGKGSELREAVGDKTKKYKYPFLSKYPTSPVLKNLP